MTSPAALPGFPPQIPSPRSLPVLNRVMVGCTRCDLALTRTQVVPGAGDAGAAVMFVGEAPGKAEDLSGVPFVGASGKLLDQMLAAAGIAREDVFIGNVIRCRPPGNRNPRTAEVRACADWLREQVRLIRPRLVSPLGRFALQHFIANGKITELRGMLQSVDYHGLGVALFPLLHPAAVLRNPRLRDSYQEHFQLLASLCVQPAIQL